MRTRILFFIFCLGSFISAAQQKDSLKKESDSVKVVIQKAEKSKDSIQVMADTVRNWKKGGILSLQFTQSSFTNWAAGGENALSGTALVSLFANYKKDKWSWDNTLDLGYGLLQSGEGPVRKNEDKIDISTKAGRQAFNNWHYAFMVNFKSQFDVGYNYPDDSTVISRFMAPAYIIASLGLDYKSPDNSLSVLISPITSKTTIVNDERLADLGAFGVEPAEFDTVGGVYTMTARGSTIRYELGAYLKLSYTKEILKNVNYTTKLELFSNYLQDPQNIDVLWENNLGLKVNKFITASLTTNLIYDHDIPVPVERTVNGITEKGTGPRLQFKQVLAIGFMYKF